MYLAVALLAAGGGVGMTLELHSLLTGSAMASFAQPQVKMNSSRVYGKVAPSVVDVSADLRFLNETAEGTGFVIDAARGLILTNNHVIDGATSVMVTTAMTGRTYRATVVGYDLPADIAVLRISDAKGLVAAVPGDSGALQAGAQVLALGNEAGQGGPPTLASGVISSTGRSIVASDHSSGLTETLHDMLQTSADIRPGDSGGPLADAAGHVIGVDTAAGDAGPDSTFAGYAIPIDAALTVARQISEGRTGSSIHLGMPALLGVLLPGDSKQPDGTGQHGQARKQARKQASYGASGPGCVSSYDAGFTSVPAARVVPAPPGAVVDGVVCDTPAADAGLMAGDVITAFGDQPVTTAAGLSAILDRDRPGLSGTLTWVTMAGATRTAVITLGTGPAG